MKDTLYSSILWRKISPYLNTVFHDPNHMLKPLTPMFIAHFVPVDSLLPYSLESSIQNMWSMLFAFLMICFVFPWFLLPLLVITTIYQIVSKVFRSVLDSSLNKREEKTLNKRPYNFVSRVESFDQSFFYLLNL